MHGYLLVNHNPDEALGHGAKVDVDIRHDVAHLGNSLLQSEVPVGAPLSVITGNVDAILVSARSRKAGIALGERNSHSSKDRELLGVPRALEERRRDLSIVSTVQQHESPRGGRIQPRGFRLLVQVNQNGLLQPACRLGEVRI